MTPLPSDNQPDNSMQVDNTHVDIIIVGGGIVGLTLANALANLQTNTPALSIAIIEHSVAASIPENGQTDLRVSALNRRAVDYFKSIGLWPRLQQRYGAFEKMFVWDTTGVGQIQFDSAELGLPYLGCIVENSVLVQALWENLQQAENIHCYSPAEIVSIEPYRENNSHYAVTLQNGLRLTTALLVGADGAASRVRAAAGFESIRSSYRQQGLVCAVVTEKSHQNTAWQCFMPSGPLAFLPLFNAQSSIVWTLDEERAQAMMALSENDFKQALAQASEYQLGDIKAVSERKLFPLAHGHVNNYVKPGLALIGDAAHIIHPLAGQGANLGIADAICLATIIGQAKATNRQWNALHTLLKYQRQRKLENRLMENSMTGFKTLFGQKNPLLTEVRNAGLSLVDHLPFFKNKLIRQALGG